MRRAAALSPLALSLLRNARADTPMATAAFGPCSHPGVAGSCLPRVRDGRCVWCERDLPTAGERWNAAVELEDADLAEISRSGRGELMIEATDAGRQLIDGLEAGGVEVAS